MRSVLFLFLLATAMIFGCGGSDSSSDTADTDTNDTTDTDTGGAGLSTIPSDFSAGEAESPQLPRP